jgi:hypothetical protein
MYKLIILLEKDAPPEQFDLTWPAFLQQAEQMPGLLRETTSWVDGILTGERQPQLVHELYFESQQALQQAMLSPAGQAAGRLLQQLSGGRMTLAFAHHLEDDLPHIRQAASPDEAVSG